MTSNRHALDRLLADARRLLDGGDLEAAAGVTQLAAHHASFNHCGAFAVPEIEALCQDLAELAMPPAPAAVRSPAIRSVLHVLTEGYETGGHTRLAWRWMTLDDARRHDVVLTQPRVPVPSRLAGAAATLTTLAGHGGLLERAAALRAAAADHDAVVLHIHQWDVVAPIALAAWADGRPPVVFLDHVDNMAWVGAATADLVCGLRGSGIDLGATRRGIAAERFALLPIPLDVPERSTERAAAKARLGIAASTPVVVTIGTAHKFETTPDDIDLPALVEPALAEHGAVLIAVGPEPTGRWADAAAHTNGGVRALGPLPDVTAVYEAADVYVDSWPVKGITTLLEAAGYGVPSLAYSPPERIPLVLDSDDPALEATVTRAATPAAFRAALGSLLADDAARLDLGARTRAAVVDVHAPAAWRRALESAYARAAALATMPQRRWPGVPIGGADQLDHARHLQLARSGVSTPLGIVVRHHADLLAPGARPTISVVTRSDGRPEDDVACLTAALGAVSASGRVELVLVDPAGSEVLAELEPEVAVVAGDTWGDGLTAATGHLVLLVSPDVTVSTAAYAALLRAMRDDPTAAALTPVVASAAGHAGSNGLDASSGVCLLVRAEVLGRSGVSSRAVADAVVHSSAVLVG